MTAPNLTFINISTSDCPSNMILSSNLKLNLLRHAQPCLLLKTLRENDCLPLTEDVSSIDDCSRAMKRGMDVDNDTVLSD